MRFLKLLQVQPGQPRQVPDPMELGFDVDVFNRAFIEFQDGSPEDISAGHFGALIGYRVRCVFDSLKAFESQIRECSYDEVAETIADMLQAMYVDLSKKQYESIQDFKEFTFESLRHLPVASDAVGNQLPLQNLLDSFVDSIRHPLRHARDSKSLGGKGHEHGEENIHSIIGVSIRFGSMLEALRRQWHLVQWGQALAQVSLEQPYPYILREGQSRLALLSHVDIERRHGLRRRNMGFLPMLDERGPFGRKKVLVTDVSSSNNRKLRAISIADIVDAELRSKAVYMAASHEAGIDTEVRYFLKKDDPSLKGANFEMVLDAWFCLSLLATQQFDERFSNMEQAEEVIPLMDLEHALATALEIPLIQAKAVVQFLIYKGKQHSIWSRPLLSVAKGVLLLVWPLQSAYLMRLIHDWGKTDLPLYAKKGSHYENMVQDVMNLLHTKVKSNLPFIPLRCGIKVHGKREDGNDVGDVDGAFIVDDTLFIMECRAVMHPAEPYEFWLVERELREKTAQAMAKKHYVSQNLDIVAYWGLQGGHADPLPQIRRVVALVVSNSYLLEGENLQEPYFVHFDTIFQLLIQGYNDFGASAHADGTETIYRIPCRRPGLSDSDSLILALKKPVKGETFKACVETTIFNPGQFDETDAPGMQESYVLNIPTTADGVTALLHRCGLSDRMIKLRLPSEDIWTY